MEPGLPTTKESESLPGNKRLLGKNLEAIRKVSFERFETTDEHRYTQIVLQVTSPPRIFRIGS